MPIVRGEVRANGTHSTSVLTHTAHTPTTIDTAAAEFRHALRDVGREALEQLND